MAGAAILVVIGGTVFVSGKRPKDEKGSGISENIGVDSDELLTLVNAEHPMPSEWQCELVQLNNGQNIDSRAYEDLQQMNVPPEQKGMILIYAHPGAVMKLRCGFLKKKFKVIRSRGILKGKRKFRRPSGSQYREPASMNSDLHWISYLWKTKAGRVTGEHTDTAVVDGALL